VETGNQEHVEAGFPRKIAAGMSGNDRKEMIKKAASFMNAAFAVPAVRSGPVGPELIPAGTTLAQG
jgi:hypothetical protein